MKNTTKRLTALLLALTMCLSLLSAPVWAVEEPEDGSVSAQSSEAEESASEAEETEQESEESAPEAKESAQEPEEFPLEPEETAPESEETALEEVKSAQKPEETAPEAEETAPEAETAQEPEETAPEAEKSDAESEEELTAQEIVASGNCGKNGDNVTWSLDDEGTLTISGAGEMEYYSEEPPWPTESVKKVVITDGVSDVGSYGFCDHENLTSVILPNSVKWMGAFAFSGCSSLTSVSFGNQLSVIGTGAFEHCTMLKSIELPDSVLVLDDTSWSPDGRLFSGCTSLTSVKLPANLTEIPAATFEGCVNLQTIEIPAHVRTISSWAFSNCTSLSSITLPNNLKTIDSYAFYRCDSLKQMTIPASVNRIGEKAIGFTGVGALGEAAYFKWLNGMKKVPQFAVSGYSGTDAEDYAKDNDFPFTSLGTIKNTHCWSKGDITKLSTCVAEGEVTYVCTDCGEEQVLTLPIMPDAHNWDAGVVTKKPTCDAAGEKTFTCTLCHTTRTEVIDKLEKPEAEPKAENTITAPDVVKSYSPKAQSFHLNASALGGAVLSYNSGSNQVQVDETGKVTFPAKFSGAVNITITSAETAQYKPATKTVTVTVPTVTKIKKATGGKGQITLAWKKNKTGKKYEIQVSIKKDFKKTAKKVVINKNTILKTTVKGLKKGSYFVRIRTVSDKVVSNWSGVKKVSVK